MVQPVPSHCAGVCTCEQTGDEFEITPLYLAGTLLIKFLNKIKVMLFYLLFFFFFG